MKSLKPSETSQEFDEKLQKKERKKNPPNPTIEASEHLLLNALVIQEYIDVLGHNYQFLCIKLDVSRFSFF